MRKNISFHWLLVAGMLAQLVMPVAFTRADSGAPWAAIITTNSDNVTVRVHVNDPSYIRLEYGLSTAYNIFMPAGSTATSASTDWRINPSYVNGVSYDYADYTLTGLCANTTYRFRVGSCSAYKGDECRANLSLYAFGGQYDFKTAAGSPTCADTIPADTIPPEAPGNMTVSDVTSTHVALSWSIPQDNVGVTRYDLKYKIGGTAFIESDWASALSLPVGQPLAPVSGGGVTTFGYNELTPNTTYILALKAYDAAGNESPLAVSPSFTTLALPIAPSNLRLDPTPSTSAIFLKWIDNSFDENVFNVDRKFISDTNFAGTLHWAQLPANTTSFSDTNVVSGQHYDYRVQACNSAGCSAFASLSDAVTQTVTAPSTSSGCTSLAFSLADNKTSYNTGDMVNYSYSCLPAGTTAASVVLQVLKPDGTATTYVTGNNVGAVPQQMGFSTSNLTAGSYILRACLNSASCEAGSAYPIPFTIVSEARTTQPAASSSPSPSTLPPSAPSSAPMPSSPINQPIQTTPGTTSSTSTTTPPAPTIDLNALSATPIQPAPNIQPSASTPSLSTLEECFRNVLGEARYNQVHNNAVRPTNEELEKAKPCFGLIIINEMPSVFVVPALTETTKSVSNLPQFTDTCETRQLPSIKRNLNQLRRNLSSINKQTLRLRKANVLIPTEFDLLYENANNLIKNVDGAKTCEDAYSSGLELPEVMGLLTSSLAKIEKLRFARKALNSLDVATKSLVNSTNASLNRLAKQKFDVADLKDQLNSQKAEIASCRADAEILLKDNEPELFEDVIISCFDILDSASSLNGLASALIDARRFLNNRVMSLIDSSTKLAKKLDKAKKDSSDLKEVSNVLKKRRDNVLKDLNNLKLDKDKLRDEINSVIVLASDLEDTMNEIQGISSFDRLVEKPLAIALPEFSKSLTNFFK